MEIKPLNYVREDSIYEIDSITFDKLVKLVSNNSWYYDFLNEIKSKQDQPYKLNYNELDEIMDWIIGDTDLHYDLNPFDVNHDTPSYLSSLETKYNELIEEYLKIRKINSKEEIRKTVYDFRQRVLENEDELVKLIDISHKITRYYDDYYYLRDLGLAGESILPNLSGILSNEEINNIIQKYTEALNNMDTLELQKILNEVQDIILNHWKESITSVDEYKPGDKFQFICHSTYNTDRSGDFKTRYVSTSLISDKLTDTFSCGFGFILPPENIVGAKSSDMYVKNNEKEDGKLPYASTIKQIDSPELIIKKCLEQKRQNIENDEYRSVYSEIVIDGFNPIAIFCLTDGSKELDPNYQSAKKLQEHYPNLKIVDIDQTYYKTGIELDKLKQSLLERINYNIVSSDPANKNNNKSYNKNLASIRLKDVNKYNLFWNEYMQIKRQNNLSTEQITKLFMHNDKLIKMKVDDHNIFDNLSDIELDTVLKYNENINICEVLDGNIDIMTFDRIFNALKDKKNDQRLDTIIPGLTTFIKLYDNAPMTPENIHEMFQFNSFTDINNYLINLIKEYQNDKKNEIESLYTKKNYFVSQIAELTLDKEKKQAQLEEKENNIKLSAHEYLYSIATLDIGCTQDNINLYESKKDSYVKTQQDTKERLSSITTSLNKLNKHKILNFFKIRKLKKQQELESINEQNITEKLNAINSSIQDLENEIQKTKESFIEKVGIEYDKFKAELEKAKKNIVEINEYNIAMQIVTIEFKIESLKQDIKLIESQISQKEKDNDTLVQILPEYNQEKDSR